MHAKDNGYLGGIVDGEGCISIMYCKGSGHKTTTTALAISVYQADKRLIDWLVYHYGGKFYEHTMKNSTRSGYVWFAPTGKSREDFLLLLIPHLLLKKEQAMLALEYVRLPRTHEATAKRFELAGRCQELNRFVSNQETSKRKRDELAAHQKESYFGPRRDTSELVTTNMPSGPFWQTPSFSVISPRNSRAWRAINKGLKIESELHGDMQSAPGVIPDECLSQNDRDNLEYMASLRKDSLA